MNTLLLPLLLPGTGAWPHKFGRRFPATLVVLVVSSLALLSSSAIATPIEEITRALTATGRSDVGQMAPRQFLKAFNAVALRIPPRALPDYVTAAVRLRPSLAPNIVAVATKAAARNSEAKPEALYAVIQRILKAAIAENPEVATMIAKAAVSASPELRRCILAAAMAAAPEQKEAIASAVDSKALPFAFLTFSAADPSGFAFTAGTLSPANISDLGSDASVTSPEQPPSSR